PASAFDPNVPQAVAQTPSDLPAGTIAQLFQPGWRIGERTLRAAMVAVSLGAAN
ncbi:MAG TPA: nucleotide exchange factor GrpE, partial [Hyphomonas sp.]|nr:nucleotide exchange factor GrpE [Hyphomonas sp.]